MIAFPTNRPLSQPPKLLTSIPICNHAKVATVVVHNVLFITCLVIFIVQMLEEGAKEEGVYATNPQMILGKPYLYPL